MAATQAEEVPTAVTVRELLDAGLHFGHQTKRWNPKMKRYIFDKRSGIHIIDLTKSLESLQAAMDFVYNVAITGKNVLFVGTKKQAQQVVKDAATSCGQPYVVTRWLGGSLTNNVTIRKSIKRMREIDAMEQSGEMAKMHKKELSALRHEQEKLHRNLLGIADMASTPGAIFVVDVLREAIAVKEANKLKVPVVAIVDTNCDPDPIDYVIPGNDDAIRGIKLISGAIAASVKKAAAEYARVAAEVNKKRETERAAEESRRAASRAETKTRKPEGDRAAEADKSARRAKDGDRPAAKPRAAAKKAEEKAAPAPAAAEPTASTENPTAS